MQKSRLKYPIGQQDFSFLRENGFVYIDKTGLIYSLINRIKYVFLARPRRFGKSLLLSTIKAYFEGRKDLFNGLAIEKLEKKWEKYPVFLLELSRIRPDSTDSLKETLNQQFNVWEKELGINNTTSEFGSRFATIITEAYFQKGKRTIILIDEYDNPLINSAEETNSDISDKNKNLLRSVYSNLKALDGYIQFAMLSGVSRFSKMSIFSGINNLMDITFSNEFSTICGFTEDEIRGNLWDGVIGIGKEYNLSETEALKLLKNQYDGYHFSEKSPDIYNPFSLLLALENKKIGKYWIETATPKFLADKLKRSSQSFINIFNASSDSSNLSEPDTTFSSPVSLLYQTGYLTIKGYLSDSDRYLLGVPNKEVENGLFVYLLSQFSGKDSTQSEDWGQEFSECLENGRITEFTDLITRFYTEIPYDIIPVVSEKYFQHVLYLLMKVARLETEAEKRHSYGRSDLVVKTGRYIYIFELKLDKSAQEALNQIKDKKYALSFLNDGRKIIEIGINFSSSTRTIDSIAFSEIQH